MAQAPTLTLLDVIQAVSEVAANEEEILAMVVHLISSGQVRLSNDAVRAMRELCAPADAAAQRRGGTRAMPRDDGVITWSKLAEAWLIMGIVTFLLLV